MVEKLKALYLKHGLKIMLAGFSLSAIGILLYIKMHRGTPGSKIGFALVIAGLVLYVIGRVGVVLERRAAGREREKLQSGTDEEDESQ